VDDVEEMHLGIPSAFRLEQNFPNPFNPTTTITFQIPNSSYVTLNVYDVLGREVRRLVNEELTAGAYKTTFDATGLASGVYVYTLHAGDVVQTKKLVLLR
jgi:glucuronoarabinoxylan endo-1,4-beta-xylanase